MTGAWLVTVAMCTEVLKAMFSRENVQTLRALGTKQCLQFTFSGDILAGNRDYCLLLRTGYQQVRSMKRFLTEPQRHGDA
jgi:hypothetical protein